uniref:Uncharacterized protein n=1 Tax=Romanomermis culicivorax TaxID=13658 RepID=A0A915IBN8_ROMCU
MKPAQMFGLSTAANRIKKALSIRQLNAVAFFGSPVYKRVSKYRSSEKTFENTTEQCMQMSTVAKMVQDDDMSLSQLL